MQIESLSEIFIRQTASGLAWQPRIQSAEQERAALAIAQQLGVPEMVARVVAGRGISIDEAPDFLNPTIKSTLPDPSHLLDMDKAVERLIKAIGRRETIAVFGDYDVDGATSTALLSRYFAALGVRILTYIPDRMKEGYGPNLAAFELLKAQESSIIITVDCGTVSYDPIAYAAQHGIDVIVIDHHVAQAELPAAHAIVNPNRIDQDSPCGHLAAVGVVFLLLVALNRALRAQGREALPDLLQWLDIVALGTVCDVVALTGLNRAYVAQGLKVMRQRRNPGISALLDVARLDEPASVYHAGFIIGPRINAGGRVGESALGEQILSLNNPEECSAIAVRLDQYNSERQAIEASVLEAAMAQAEVQTNQPCIIVAANGWHEGVIGIVAGRIKERFDRPAVVIRIHEGIGKASARSIPGADIGAAVIAARQQGLLLAGGGHAMAAGFSLDMAHYDALTNFLCDRLTSGVARYTERRAKLYDGMVSAGGLTLGLLDQLEEAGPFGMGNPGPKIMVPEARIIQCMRMKDKHYRVIFGDKNGNARVTGVTFNGVDTPLGNLLETSVNKRLHLLGCLRRNSWQGHISVQFMIEDVAAV
jgi:single-stranded-DNA-specific exonuclease